MLSWRPSVDSRRFRTAATHYLPGRPAYPPALIAEVARAAGLTGAHRLLDLGTGPGVLAIAFAPYVGSVLAVDPEPEMLRVAEEVVRKASLNVEVRAGSSLTIEPAWGRFRAVTLGRSFHWMDREETLSRLDLLIEPGGAVILFDDRLADVPGNAGLRAWSEVVERYSADDRVRMERRSAEWQDHASVLRRSPFSSLEFHVLVHRSSTTVEVLIHRALSMSATSAARLGDRTEPMLAEIRATLAPFTERGELAETIEWTATLARRPDEVVAVRSG